MILPPLGGGGDDFGWFISCDFKIYVYG